MSLRAVSFDLDETLIDRTGAFREALLERLEKGGMPAEKRGPALEAILALDERGKKERADFWRAAILKAPALGWDPKELQRWGAPAIAARLRPDPAVRAMLEGLRARGLKLALVTNGAGDHQREKLAKAGLTDLFQVLVISGEAGVRKPDPAIYRLALEQLGLSAAEVLHVGDDPERDVEAARQAGLQVAWVEGDVWPEGLARPALALRSVTELAGKLPA